MRRTSKCSKLTFPAPVSNLSPQRSSASLATSRRPRSRPPSIVGSGGVPVRRWWVKGVRVGMVRSRFWGLRQSAGPAVLGLVAENGVAHARAAVRGGD